MDVMSTYSTLPCVSSVNMDSVSCKYLLILIYIYTHGHYSKRYTTHARLWLTYYSCKDLDSRDTLNFWLLTGLWIHIYPLPTTTIMLLSSYARCALLTLPRDIWLTLPRDIWLIRDKYKGDSVSCDNKQSALKVLLLTVKLTLSFPVSSVPRVLATCTTIMSFPLLSCALATSLCPCYRMWRIERWLEWGGVNVSQLNFSTRIWPMS
jgi:hypothetical protein